MAQVQTLKSFKDKLAIAILELGTKQWSKTIIRTMDTRAFPHTPPNVLTNLFNTVQLTETSAREIGKEK